MPPTSAFGALFGNLPPGSPAAATQVPSLKDDNFMVVLLSGILVAYLANHAMDIAKKIGGSIDDSMGQKIKSEGTRLWNNAYGEYKKLKKIIKENKK